MRKVPFVRTSQANTGDVNRRGAVVRERKHHGFGHGSFLSNLEGDTLRRSDRVDPA